VRRGRFPAYRHYRGVQSRTRHIFYLGHAPQLRVECQWLRYFIPLSPTELSASRQEAGEAYSLYLHHLVAMTGLGLETLPHVTLWMHPVLLPN